MIFSQLHRARDYAKWGLWELYAHLWKSRVDIEKIPPERTHELRADEEEEARLAHDLPRDSVMWNDKDESTTIIVIQTP